MDDLVATGVAWLVGMLQEHASQPVVYQRGSQSVAVRATIGRTDWDTQTREGYSEHFVSRDYMIPVASLVIDGSAIEPEKGDRIVETVGGQVKTYEVLGQSGVPPAELDRYRLQWRVHTKEIDPA